MFDYSNKESHFLKQINHHTLKKEKNDTLEIFLTYKQLKINLDSSNKHESDTYSLNNARHLKVFNK